MRTGPVLLAVVVLFALAGCTPADSRVTDAPSASATPAFASDAEALAAAEKAYAAYLKVSAEITADGGSGVTRIDPLVTKAQAAREYATYLYFSDRHLQTRGTPTLGNVTLQSVEFFKSGGTKLAFYACVDATDVRVLDTSGVDVTPSDRTDLTALQVIVQSSSKHPSRLLVAESDRWSGAGVCI